MAESEVYPSKQGDSKEILVNSLDDLLERYLHLLNQYQTIQHKLTQLFSRGYLQLAQANFSNPNRVRYGQEHYDDRMQASTRVSISRLSPYFSTPRPEAQKSVSASGGVDDDDEFNTAPPPCKGTETGSNTTRDSLNWFGLLVPPALRTSQSSFKDAVADLVPALASTSKEMGEVEIEVSRTRKRLRKAF